MLQAPCFCNDDDDADDGHLMLLLIDIGVKKLLLGLKVITAYYQMTFIQMFHFQEIG